MFFLLALPKILHFWHFNGTRVPADMLTPNQNRNVVRLTVAQALSMTSMNVNIINTALVGGCLPPWPGLRHCRCRSF